MFEYLKKKVISEEFFMKYHKKDKKLRNFDILSHRIRTYCFLVIFRKLFYFLVCNVMYFYINLHVCHFNFRFFSQAWRSYFTNFQNQKFLIKIYRKSLKKTQIFPSNITSQLTITSTAMNLIYKLHCTISSRRINCIKNIKDNIHQIVEAEAGKKL